MYATVLNTKVLRVELCQGCDLVASEDDEFGKIDYSVHKKGCFDITQLRVRILVIISRGRKKMHITCTGGILILHISEETEFIQCHRLFGNTQQ